MIKMENHYYLNIFVGRILFKNTYSCIFLCFYTVVPTVTVQKLLRSSLTLRGLRCAACFFFWLA